VVTLAPAVVTLVTFTGRFEVDTGSIVRGDLAAAVMGATLDGEVPATTAAAKVLAASFVALDGEGPGEVVLGPLTKVFSALELTLPSREMVLTLR